MSNTPNLCRKCSVELTSENWSASRAKKYDRTCKKCTAIYRKKYAEANPLKAKTARRYHTIKYLYGLSSEEYEAMLQKQDRKCKICKGDPGSKGSLHVDHCHKTNRVRGLLCHSCNVVLGLMKDNTENFARAIAYLKEAGE